MTIDILCKVVDNYGDIGVVFRLARALSALPETPLLRLIVDDLAAFRALDPSVDPEAEMQSLHGWEIYRWDLSPEAIAAFAARPPRILLQCFACPRPEWLEELLFGAGAPESRIIDLEYLSAEDFARDMHRMPSLTRSANVRKTIFFPGLEAGTGGLILDPAFSAARGLVASPQGRAELRRELLERLAAAPALESAFWVLVFSYERDYSRIVSDLAAYSERLLSEGRAAGGSGDSPQPGSAPRSGTCLSSMPRTNGILALVAAGKSRDCFLAAWRAAGEPFPILDLPFLPQESWDRALLACDFAIVRGEDSWSRAILSGRPFLWQAYPQDGRHQMVKVDAFLRLLRPHFSETAFAPLSAAFRSFNDRDLDAPSTRGEDCILPLLEDQSALTEGFRAFADSVFGLGDLAESLAAELGAGRGA